ncbi:MAG: NIPSNAP family protein [Hyphomicrobiales bacterium]|nr:NIPSNAP family protein [Hyphomicrobiales bacterium]
MLIEHRAYTMRPGLAGRFVEMQSERGFESVRSTMERLIGYFHVVGGPDDEIIHLYRYDSLDDWYERLHGFYAAPTSNAYLGAVRKLMIAQENRFFAPAPVSGLTPVWGGEHDWLPTQPSTTPFVTNKGQIVEEATLVLTPGLLDDYWESWEQNGLQAQAVTRHLLATFYCLTGRLHQIVFYTLYDSLEQREAHRQALLTDAAWLRHLDFVRPRTSSHTVKLLRPVDVPEMSPFFIDRKLAKWS